MNINDDLTYEQLGIREDNDDYIYEDDDGFEECSENDFLNEQILKVKEEEADQAKIEKSRFKDTPEQSAEGEDTEKNNTNGSIIQMTP